jgi:hypothetical protein
LLFDEQVLQQVGFPESPVLASEARRTPSNKRRANEGKQRGIAERLWSRYLARVPKILAENGFEAAADVLC